MDKLPPYEEVAARPASSAGAVGREEAGSQQAVWASDAILATRMQLLMSLVGACLPALSQVLLQHTLQPFFSLFVLHATCGSKAPLGM